MFWKYTGYCAQWASLTLWVWDVVMFAGHGWQLAVKCLHVNAQLNQTVSGQLTCRHVPIFLQPPDGPTFSPDLSPIPTPAGCSVMLNYTFKMIILERDVDLHLHFHILAAKQLKTVCLGLSICGSYYNHTFIRLLPNVVLHDFISSITVSTTGSALMMLIRDLLQVSPRYIAAHFLKWQPGGAERREQTYHAASVDTLLFSQPLQPTQAPWRNHSL